MWYSTRLLRVDVAEPHDRADRDDARVDLVGVDHARVREPLLELRDLVLEHRLLVLRVVVLGVLGDVAELAGVRIRSATSRRWSVRRASRAPA